MSRGFHTLAELLDWLGMSPPGTMLSAVEVRRLMVAVTGDDEAIRGHDAIALPGSGDWKERLWCAPAATRIGVEQLAEALGRSSSWVYKHTSLRSGSVPIPHRRLGTGKLEFVVSDIREWITQMEVIA